MMLPRDTTKLEKARKLRREMTAQERKLWYTFLRSYPVKIYKQRIIGPYIVDFYCDSAKLVIEIDGSQHYEEKGMAYDENRSRFLRSLGLEVLRFSNADINLRFSAVCQAIDNSIHKRRFCPPLSQPRG